MQKFNRQITLICKSIIRASYRNSFFGVNLQDWIKLNLSNSYGYVGSMRWDNLGQRRVIPDDFGGTRGNMLIIYNAR